MTDKELKMFITNLINEKVNENENFIRYTFYELRVKYNLTEKEVDETLRMKILAAQERQKMTNA